MAKPKAVYPERMYAQGSGGRPASTSWLSEIQPLPEVEPKAKQHADWREVRQPLVVKQTTEQQVPPRPNMAKLSEAFTPPESRSGKLTAQGKAQSRKAAKREKEGSSQGRAMSFLLTTMPEITDIGFRGGINFVKKLSRASSSDRPRLRAESVPRQTAQPAVEGYESHKHRKQPGPAQLAVAKRGKPRKERSQAADDAADAASLQALLDKDWLYATMPAASPPRSPANLHLLKPGSSKPGEHICLPLFLLPPLSRSRQRV